MLAANSVMEEKSSAPAAPMFARYREWVYAAAFLLPNVIGIGLFVVVPVIAGFVLSFSSWDMLSPPQWIGLENYRSLINDSRFWDSLKNTLVYTAIVIPGGVSLSLLLALALNTRISGTKFYQAVFFLPYVTSTVAIALVWKWLYNPDYGVLNIILGALGLPQPNWLTDPSSAMTAVAIVSIWQTAGYNMVLFLAGLRSIPRQYYEAAELDGASSWHKFWFITIPLLMPTLFFVTATSFIASFQVFNLVYVMTDGGPGGSTRVLVYYLWENGFSFFKMGYASAMAYVLFLVMLAITLLQVKYMGRDRAKAG